MSNKKNKKNYKPVIPHFRKASGKASGHPTRIHGQDKDNYYYVQFTHAERTRGVKNLPLKKNPNKSDLKPSYVLASPQFEKKSKFKNTKLKGWRLRSGKDRKIIREIKKKKHK